MIPKILHYCWFGGQPKSAKIKKCIRSWKKYCPDFRIIEWNETNFNYEIVPYCKTAYRFKKWAFVTDYVRLKVLYDYGGIYMDTDVELIKSIDSFLEYDCFMGFQHEKYVNNGLITGAEKHHPFIKENMEIYENLNFVNEADSTNFIVCQKYTTDLLEKKGLKFPCDGTIQRINNICIFPPEYFCPFDHRTYKMNITPNTVAIHHFASSWWDEKRKREYNAIKWKNRIHRIQHLPNRLLIHALGNDKYEEIKEKLKGGRRK